MVVTSAFGYLQHLGTLPKFPVPAESQYLDTIMKSKPLASQLSGLFRTVSDMIMARDLSPTIHLAVLRPMSELKPM